MPELPEVETIVRGLRAKIAQNIIIDSKLFRDECLNKNSLKLETLIGQEIIAVERRGKLIVLKCHAENAPEPTYCIFHLRMTGALLLKDINQNFNNHTRLAFLLENQSGQKQTLFFEDIRGFGQAFVAPASKLNTWSFWQKLGPEPLTLELPTFAKILTRFKGKAIKAMLLDQEALAGIGNIYADESLFKAKIHPKRKAGTLNAKEQEELLAAIKDNLNISIQNGGTTFRNYQDADGHKGHNQDNLLVYGRAGQKCPRCGKILEKLTVAGRGTVICSHCQPE